MTFRDLAIKVLEEEKIPLSPEAIWELSVKKGYDKILESKGKTPIKSLAARIYTEIQYKKQESVFVKVGTRPTQFTLSKLAGSKIVTLPREETIKKFNYSEMDLHPLLTYFLSTNMQVYSKTINHLTSKKKEFGEWVHPDMVGWYFPVEDWNNSVFELSNQMANNPIRLFSFEIKKSLAFSNLRESFFQCVSNSSWANEGYLVAAELSQNNDFQNELKRLSSSFGIGVIGLDTDDPDSSEIIYPAKIKDFLDWDTINKLTMNSDFETFINRIKKDITSKEIRKEKYNKVLGREIMIKMFKKKTRNKQNG